MEKVKIEMRNLGDWEMEIIGLNAAKNSDFAICKLCSTREKRGGKLWCRKKVMTHEKEDISEMKMSSLMRLICIRNENGFGSFFEILEEGSPWIFWNMWV